MRENFTRTRIVEVLAFGKPTFYGVEDDMEVRMKASCAKGAGKRICEVQLCRIKVMTSFRTECFYDEIKKSIRSAKAHGHGLLLFRFF